MSIVNVLVPAPYRLGMRGNTDYSYLVRNVPRLVQYDDHLRVSFPLPGKRVALNAEDLIERASSKLMRGYARTWSSRMPDSGARSIDVLFTNRKFPVASTKPVVWMDTLIDPAMRLNRGDTAAEVERELRLKKPLFQKAAAIVVVTQAERQRLVAEVGVDPLRVHHVPFFRPELPIRSLVGAERADGCAEVELLFVGNDTVRKGLPRIVDGLNAMPQHARRRIRLRIVSNQTSVLNPADCLFRVEWLGVRSQAEVLRLMCESDVFVNVASFETYGFVFIEAMACGLACLTPSWENQIEITEGAGISVEGSPSSIASAALCLIEDPKLRRELGEVGRSRYDSEFSPAVIGPRLATVIRGAVNE